MPQHCISLDRRPDFHPFPIELFLLCDCRPRNSAWENSCDSLPITGLNRNWTLVLRCQPSRWPKKAASLILKETNEHRTSNIERPTSNNVFYLLKGTEQNASTLLNSIRLSPSSLSSGPNGLPQAVVPFYLKSIKRSVIIIRCSMLDVRCSTFNLFTASA